MLALRSGAPGGKALVPDPAMAEVLESSAPGAARHPRPPVIAGSSPPHAGSFATDPEAHAGTTEKGVWKMDPSLNLKISSSNAVSHDDDYYRAFAFWREIWLETRNETRNEVGATPSDSCSRHSEIRTLDTVEELVASFRLRHAVYGALGYLHRCSASGLEIDEYDMFSIPFGAFDPVSGEMIGTLRLITSELQPEYAYLIDCVLASFAAPELTRQVLDQRPYPFPSVISNEIDRQISAFNTEGFAVAELSRTIVHSDHRGSGLSRRLMEFGLAYATQVAPAVLVGSCLPEHVAMYARYGYRKLPGTGLEHFASVGQDAHAVVCRTDVLPEPTRTHVGGLVRSIRSGVTAHTLEIGRDSHVVFRLATAHRARRHTREW